MVAIITADDFNLFTKEMNARFDSIEKLLVSNRNESAWLTVEEVKAKYKIKSTTTIDKLLKTAKKRFGRRVLFNQEIINTLLK